MRIFERGRIGRMVTPNRIIMCPMDTSGLIDLDNGFSRRVIAYYAARAEGGTGLIMTGVVFVNTTLEAGSRLWMSCLDSPKYVGRLSELCDAVHHYGAKLAIQLTPGFGRVNSTRGNPVQPVSASATRCFWDSRITTRELTIEEIQLLVKSYATAAGMAKMAGVDAIEIHGYGGYLLDQFQTSLWNKRTDKYGGDLDGRLRFSMEIIGASRKAVGKDFPLIYKFTPVHYIEGGRTIEEGLEIAKRLENAGIDALHVVGGCYEIWHRAIPSMYEPQASWLHLAEAVKKVVKIPVIADGKLGCPDIAEKAIVEGKADFIGLGRPLLADPEWSRKVKEGRTDDIIPCIGDGEGCIGRAYEMKYLSCTVNPNTGMEKEYTLTPAARRKRVLIVGGGPAGLEAARVAASRGHEVTLWEKGSRLGGNLITASVPDFKRDISLLIDYLSNQVKKLGVKVELEKEGTPGLIEKLNPEAIIVATGASPLVPGIPGIRGDNVVTAVDVMLGRKAVDQTVIVAGGGMVGCETAAHLATKGKKITIIEMMGKLVPEGTNPNNMMAILNLIKQSQVEVLTDTKLIEVTKEGAIVGMDNSRRELKADAVILALGFQPESRLCDVLEGKVPEIYAIGDCVQPRRIINAIWEGFHTSRLI